MIHFMIILISVLRRELKKKFQWGTNTDHYIIYQTYIHNLYKLYLQALQTHNKLGKSGIFIILPSTFSQGNCLRKYYHVKLFN
jgi:hypothetical protein